jgi:hypothetical protein
MESATRPAIGALVTDKKHLLDWPRLVLALPVLMVVYEQEDDGTPRTRLTVATSEDDLGASMFGLFMGGRN